MFDKLGDGWPKHSCFDQRYRELKERVLPILKKGAKPATFQPFAKLAEEFGFEVPIDSITPIPVAKDGKSPPPPKPKPADHITKRMDPMPEEEMSFVGIIRERVGRTGRLKALYAALGDIGRKLFGLPPAKRAVQLTIIDAGGEPNESYSCVADERDLDASLEVGVMVHVSMVGKVAGSTTAWIVREIHEV